MTIQQWDNSTLLALNRLVGHNAFFDFLVKFVAVYSVYAVPIVLVVLWFQKKREVAIRAALSGLVYLAMVQVIGHFLWFRPRPPLAELGGQEILFHRPDFSFPSDHAGFFAALTMTFYLLGSPKLARVFLVATLLMSLARIMLGFHYPTDILAGWVLGPLTAYAVHYERIPIDKYLSQPLIKLARMIRLA